MIDLPISDTWLMALVFLLIAAVALRRVSSTFMLIMGFAYPNARFSAMGNEYVTRQGISKLKDARTLEEAVTAVSSRDYEFPPHASADADSALSALDRIEDMFTSMLLEEIPKNATPFFRALLYRDELEALREGFIARFDETGIADERSVLARLDRITADTDPLKKDDASDDENDETGPQETVSAILRSSDSPTEAAQRLSDRYPFLGSHGMGDALVTLEATGDVTPFEYLMDAEYFDNLIQRENHIAPALRPVLKDLRKLHSDVFNVRTALRGVAAELSPEDIRKRFVPPGGEIPQWKLDLMADSRDVNEAIDELRGTPLDITSGETEDGQHSRSRAYIEARLDSVLLERSIDLAQRYGLTLGGTLRFFVSKRYEMRNLSIVFRALSEGMSLEEYDGLLVTEEVNV